MRTALLSLALLASSCAGTCSAMGGGAMAAGAIGGGSIGPGAALSGPVVIDSGDACGSPPGTPSLHYAARLETAYSNTDPVPTATDQGSLGVNATQATGSAQPTFVADCLNGLPCYSFDGGDWLQTAAVTSMAQPNMVVVVAASDVASSNNLAVDGIAGTDRHLVGLLSTGNDWRMNAGAAVTGGEPVAGQWESLVATFSGASSALRVSGVTVASGDAGANALTGVTLGATFSAANLWDGRHAEVIVYDTPPDAAEVETYLECLYGAFPVAP